MSFKRELTALYRYCVYGPPDFNFDDDTWIEEMGRKREKQRKLEEESKRKMKEFLEYKKKYMKEQEEENEKRRQRWEE